MCVLGAGWRASARQGLSELRGAEWGRRAAARRQAGELSEASSSGEPASRRSSKPCEARGAGSSQRVQQAAGLSLRCELISELLMLKGLGLQLSDSSAD